MRILFLAFKHWNLMSPVVYDRNIPVNTGDFVYFMAGASFFYAKNIDTVYISREELRMRLDNDVDWAKDNFDICIHMEANMLSVTYKEVMLEKAKLFNDLKIPVYILGIGAQSSIDYDMNFLSEFSEYAKKYLDSIYQSGGAITARGNFTKFVVEELGFQNIFVSGCPSLYYHGLQHEVSNIKVNKNRFNPALNGSYISNIERRIYDENPMSIFFDQSVYLPELYEPRRIKKFERHLYPFGKLYKENRIDGDVNYYLWSKHLRERTNFSYGARIHGNIIALQNEIPAFVKIIDSRTREICEFFEIPNSIAIHFDEAKDSLYDLYTQLDYTNFNNTRRKHFIEFKSWLDDNNIPNVVGNNQEYKNLIENFEYYDYRKDILINRYKKTIFDKFPKE